MKSSAPLVHQAVSACLVDAFVKGSQINYDPAQQSCVRTLVELLQQGQRPDPALPLFGEYTRTYTQSDAFVVSLEEELQDFIENAPSEKMIGIARMYKEILFQLGSHGFRPQISEDSVLNSNEYFRATDEISRGVVQALAHIAGPALDRPGIAPTRKI